MFLLRDSLPRRYLGAQNGVGYKNMRLSSSAFESNQLIPARFTCDGADVNPSLEIEEVPEEAKSLVLIVDDPDAPMGTWIHWLVYNIDPSVFSIDEDSLPKKGIEGLNDFGKIAYGGPCPPSGTHHYHFKLYALNKVLELAPSAKRKEVEKAMAGAIISQVELVGIYQRS